MFSLILDNCGSGSTFNFQTLSWDKHLCSEYWLYQEQYIIKSSVVVASTSSSAPWSTPVRLFWEPLLAMTLAHYPTKTRIGTCYDRARNWDAAWQWENQDVTVAALANCQDAIMAKLEARPYIEREKQEMWTQPTYCGRELTVVASFILCLPNLRSITPSDSTKNLGTPGAVFTPQLATNCC